MWVNWEQFEARRTKQICQRGCWTLGVLSLYFPFAGVLCVCVCHSRPRASRCCTFCRCQRWRWVGRRRRTLWYQRWRSRRTAQNPAEKQTKDRELMKFFFFSLTRSHMSRSGWNHIRSKHLLFGLQYSPLQVGRDQFTTVETQSQSS